MGIKGPSSLLLKIMKSKKIILTFLAAILFSFGGDVLAKSKINDAKANNRMAKIVPGMVKNSENPEVFDYCMNRYYKQRDILALKSVYIITELNRLANKRTKESFKILGSKLSTGEMYSLNQERNKSKDTKDIVKLSRVYQKAINYCKIPNNFGSK